MGHAWWAASVSVAAFFASLSWGVKGHFRTDLVMPAAMRANTVLTIGSFIWWMWGRWEEWTARAPTPGWIDATAAVLALADAALFWWAVAATRRRRLSLAFSPDQPTFLVANGPYVWVRHPFYTSYLVFWIAAALSHPDLAYWIVPVGMTMLYTRAARMEEMKFASSPLAAEYEVYRRRTGMLLPVPR